MTSRWQAAMHRFDHRAVTATGQFERWLARGIHAARDPSDRYRYACHAWLCSGPRVTSALISRAGDPREHYLVRGQCLEMLPCRAEWFQPKTRRDRKVHRVVLSCLRDPHPNVKFWACFAAAGLRLRAAQSALHDLRNDQGLGDMGWTVAYEACEALKAIQGKPAWVDDRLPGPSPYPPLV